MTRALLIIAAALAVIALGQVGARVVSGRPVANRRIAPEVCEHQGPVTRVVLIGDVYSVTCRSGVIVEVAR